MSFLPFVVVPLYAVETNPSYDSNS
jgi:hypothetical protein